MFKTHICVIDLTLVFFFQTLYDVYDPKIYTLPIEKFPDEEKNYVDVDIIEYVIYIYTILDTCTRIITGKS